MGLCGSTEAINPDFVDLSHFELLKVVGKGGFGKVNAVTKKDTQELMALKRMEKFAVLQSNAHLNMVWVERKIMSLQSSPFLCNLLYAFQSPSELYLVMPFMQGGDLRYHLREHGPLSEAHVRFYAAELSLAMSDLHAKRVVFRDLKPENILLDDQGHLRLSDFGLGHQLSGERHWQISGQAGTKGYQAPEVLRNDSYGCEVDVWSYGVTVYELLHGQRPWKEQHIHAASPKNSDANSKGPDLSRFKDFVISSKLSPACASFLRGVLCADWTQRLGCAPRHRASDGSFSRSDIRVHWEEMRAHPFFEGIDWEALYAKRVTPPFAPDNSRANCSPEADLADQLLDHKPRQITAEQQKNFIGWDFNTALAAEPAADGTAAAAAPATHEQTKPTQPSPSPSPSPANGAVRPNGHRSHGSEDIDESKQQQQRRQQQQ